MRIPLTPPAPRAALQALLKKKPELLERLLSRGTRPEIEGRYLHWDQLRRRAAPKGLTHEEWWVGISLARNVLRIELPVTDSRRRNFHFARTDSLLLALHQIDRDMGGRLEVADPQLTHKDLRDRYIIHSLMEEAITSSQMEARGTGLLLHRGPGPRPTAAQERPLNRN